MKHRERRRASHGTGSLLLLLLATTAGAQETPSRAAPAVQEPEPARIFRAGAATSDVTPELGMSLNGGMRDRKAERIHDELHARALALDDGDTRIAVVVVDNCMVPREVFDAAKRRVHQRSGIPVDHILMSATHTHSAGTAAAVFQSVPDEEYLEFLAVRIADAVLRATHNLEPARIGWASGSVPGQVFNRRWKMRPGSIPPNPFGGIDRVKMNPPAGSPDLIEPAGPTDPELSILSVEAMDGRPIALLANYSLHYVGVNDPASVSADYFGAFAERVEQALGREAGNPPFVAIMSNGTSGDINNIDHRRQREARAPFAKIREVADEVAAEALRVHAAMAHRDWVELDAAQTELSLGVRLPSPADVAKAREVVMQAEGPEMRSLEEIYARETLLLSDYPATLDLILQVLRIGDLAIAAIPAEVFVEIGLELKRRSPLDETFTISLANGYNGYLPTPEQHALGGYETWRARSSYLEVDASPKIVDGLMGLLERVKR